MLSENKIKEEINVAYVLAIAAVRGFATEVTRVDYDSVDATINANGYLVEDSHLYSPEIKVQLKATSSPTIIDNSIHFALPTKNYNDLRAVTAVPRLLVVLCLPENREEWLAHSAEQLVVKQCAYYVSLREMPDTTNSRSVTVHIPMTNVFSPDAVFDLMLRTSRGELQL